MLLLQAWGPDCVSCDRWRASSHESCCPVHWIFFSTLPLFKELSHEFFFFFTINFSFNHLSSACYTLSNNTYALFVNIYYIFVYILQSTWPKDIFLRTTLNRCLSINTHRASAHIRHQLSHRLSTIDLCINTAQSKSIRKEQKFHWVKMHSNWKCIFYSQIRLYKLHCRMSVNTW